MISKIFPAFSGRLAALATAVAGVVIVTGLGLLVVGHGVADGTRPPTFRGAMETFKADPAPKPAPEISFTDADGHKLSLADFHGKVVLLNLWATWCGPCVEEMPSLDRLQAKLGGSRFVVLALSVDRQGLGVVKPFLSRTQIQNLATYLDPSGGAMRAFAVRGLPTTMVIDRDGKVAGRIEGMARWDSADAEALMRYYIGPSAPSMMRTQLTQQPG